MELPPKDPASYSMLTYAWVFALAAWGGIVNYLSKVKQNSVEQFSITELVGEVAISAFAGVLTFWLCELAELAPLLTACFVAVSGHMGGKSIKLIEDVLKKKAGVNQKGNP